MTFSTNINERMQWADVVKGIGILLMVIGHSDAPKTVLTWIYGFHMPLFFFLAGYLFDTKKWENKGGGRVSIQKLLKKRAKSYIIPYLVLFIINLILAILFDILLGKFNKADVPVWILEGGLYSNDIKMPDCAPLWFLTCIFVSYVYFGFIINRNKYFKIIYSICCIPAIYAIIYINKHIGIQELPWHVDAAVIASLFMLTGNLLKKYDHITDNLSTPKVILISVCSLAVYSVIVFYNGRINMVQNTYNNIILFYLSAVLMSYVIIQFIRKFVKFRNVLTDLIAFWGRNTLIFLGFNYMINIIIRKIYAAMFSEYNIILYSIIDIFSVMVACTVFSVIWNKLKQKWW